jgi:hypothetical protein
MIDLNRYIYGENPEGSPSFIVRFDENLHTSEWTTVQYFVDFLRSTGYSTELTDTLQSVIDTNSP